MDNEIVGVVSVTNREQNLMNIINNYKRQIYEFKKLFIIINKDSIDEEKYKLKCEESGINNFFIFKINENKNLGYCLNVSLMYLKKNNCKYFTKFDDDDYYSEYYIKEMVIQTLLTNADIVGKKVISYYIKELNKFFYLKKDFIKRNRFTDHIGGATISFRINNIIKYGILFDTELSSGTDYKFVKDIIKKGGNVYSTSYNNFIVIRHLDLSKHMWKKIFKKSELVLIQNDSKLRFQLKDHII